MNQTITATGARSNWFQLLKDTLRKRQFTRISSKEGNLILCSEEDFEGLLETAELLSVPGFKASLDQADKEIKHGEVFDFEDIFPR